MPFTQNVAPKIPDLKAGPMSADALALGGKLFWRDHMFYSREFKAAVFNNPSATSHDYYDRVFCMADNGEMTAANTLWDEPGRFTDALWNNRMFVKDSTGALRQIQLEEVKERDNIFKLSAPMTNISLLEPPKAPFFLKYLVPFLFWDELVEYNHLKNSYKALVSAAAKSSFRSCVDPKLLAAEAAEALRQDQQAPQQNAKQPKRKQATAEELNAFEQRLNSEAKLDNFMTDVIFKPNDKRSEQSVMEGMMNRVKASMAKKILKAIRSEPAKRTEILQKAIINYDQTQASIRDFLPKTIDPADLEEVVTKGAKAKNAMELGEKLDFIADTAQDNFYDYLQNGDNFKQLRYISFSQRNAMEKAGTLKANLYCEPLGLKKANEGPKQEAPTSVNDQNPPVRNDDGLLSKQ